MKIDRRMSAGKRFGSAFGALIALSALAIGHPAQAEARELRISRQLGLGYLQLYVTEDQKLIDNASCEEIVREYRNYSNAEREIDARIRANNAGTAAANIAGIAAFATLGFGFFTWDDNSDAKETLAEVRESRIAIQEGARKKGCRL